MTCSPCSCVFLLRSRSDQKSRTILSTIIADPSPISNNAQSSTNMTMASTEEMQIDVKGKGKVVSQGADALDKSKDSLMFIEKYGRYLIHL